MFRFSLQNLFVVVGVVALYLAAWTALGRAFGVYTILLVAIIWMSEHLPVWVRLLLSLAAAVIPRLDGAIFYLPIELVVGHEFMYIIQVRDAPRAIQYRFIYWFWLPIAAALAISAVAAYIRTLVARRRIATVPDHTLTADAGL